MDLGVVLHDGERLLGSHKTWRGLAAGAIACACVAPLLDIPAAVGAGVGVASLAGDALSSGIKRRLRLPPGANVPGLDQLPEALLPMLLFSNALRLSAAGIAVVAAAFVVANLGANRAVKAWK
jgi:hypothetical protein